MKCTRPADFGRSSRRELGVRLTNIEGELNLEIAGYQLGEGEYGDGFNCLNVDGIVQHPRGDWSFRGKYCSIKALAALADWFDVVDAGQVPDVASVGGFTSHALSFAVLGSGLRTTYSHNAEFVPTAVGELRVGVHGFCSVEPEPTCDVRGNSRATSGVSTAMSIHVKILARMAVSGTLFHPQSLNSPPSSSPCQQILHNHPR